MASESQMWLLQEQPEQGDRAGVTELPMIVSATRLQEPDRMSSAHASQQLLLQHTTALLDTTCHTRWYMSMGPPYCTNMFLADDMRLICLTVHLVQNYLLHCPVWLQDWCLNRPAGVVRQIASQPLFLSRCYAALPGPGGILHDLGHGTGGPARQAKAAHGMSEMLVANVESVPADPAAAAPVEHTRFHQTTCRNLVQALCQSPAFALMQHS